MLQKMILFNFNTIKLCQIFYFWILSSVQLLTNQKPIRSAKFSRLVSRLSYLVNETQQSWDKCRTGYDWKNEISQLGGAYLMSQKLKICKWISYACLTVIWLANSGSIELLWNNISTKFFYLCISYFLSTNVQSYQKNICEIQQTLWQVTCLASHFETGLTSHLNLR